MLKRLKGTLNYDMKCWRPSQHRSIFLRDARDAELEAEVLG